MPRNLKIILFVCGGLVALGLVWVATAKYGAPDIRKQFVSNMPAGVPDFSNTPEKLREDKYPWFVCWTHAVAPFVVRMDSGYATGGLWGSGGTTYYFWFFGFSRPVFETNQWNW